MNKSELVKKVSEHAGITREQAEKSLNALLGTMEDALCKGEKVSLVGFGSFTTYERPARTGRNPKTGEKIPIPAKKVIKFKAGSGLTGKIR